MDNKDLYTFDKINKVYDLPVSKNTFYSAAEKGEIPPPIIDERGATKTKVRKWPISSLPKIGEKYPFITDTKNNPILHNLPCAVILSYTKKGGALKSTCAFNIARIAALNGIKTCIIGLDSQCDISRTLGHYSDIEEVESLQEIEQILEGKRGLFNIFTQKSSPAEVLIESDLPTLFYIPETDSLESLAELLEGANRREYWLEENVICHLRNDFDLIVLDCSPTSGRLLQNAIYSADMIMAPIECSISNFRNFKSFETYLKRTLETLKKAHIGLKYVPTKLKNTSLSKDIFSWYLSNIPECTKKGIKLSSLMEDSIFVGKSILEHSPRSAIAEDTKEIMSDILLELNRCITRNVHNENIILEKRLQENKHYTKQT